MGGEGGDGGGVEGGVVEAGGGGGEGDAVGGPEEGLVLQVLAHSGEMVQDGDVMLRQDGAGADAGDHEQLGGLERSGREDDFAASMQGVCGG